MAKVKVKILQTRYGGARRKYKAGDVITMEESKARWVPWAEILPTPAAPEKKRTATSTAAEERVTTARETKSGKSAGRGRKSTTRKTTKRKSTKRKSSSKSNK